MIRSDAALTAASEIDLSPAKEKSRVRFISKCKSIIVVKTMN
jgi:hypothetical protein